MGCASFGEQDVIGASGGGGGMNVAFFGIKRVHLRVVHLTHALLRGKHLTPARFDLMRIVELYGDETVPQASIQNLLGVSAPTVSRMLKSLQKLGFVRLVARRAIGAAES